MTKKSEIRSGRSFLRNGQLLIPQLLELFFSYRNQVIRNEKDVDHLHEMRLAGKRLRYLMEIYQPIFDDRFAACLNSLIELLDIMGSIHECDVAGALLKEYLEEIILFNNQTEDNSSKLSVDVIRELIRQQLARRKSLFNRLGKELLRWKEEHIKTIILETLKLPQRKY